MAKKLSKKELKDYRVILLEKRQMATGTLGLHGGALTGSESSIGSQNAASGDSADQGAEAFEQDFALSILENEVNVVQKIDEALVRIDKGSFGMCNGCDKPIVKARLRAIPWAELCIDCQRQEESF